MKLAMFRIIVSIETDQAKRKSKRRVDLSQKLKTERNGKEYEDDRQEEKGANEAEDKRNDRADHYVSGTGMFRNCVFLRSDVWYCSGI